MQHEDMQVTQLESLICATIEHLTRKHAVLLALSAENATLSHLSITCA